MEPSSGHFSRNIFFAASDLVETATIAGCGGGIYATESFEDIATFEQKPHVPG